MKKIELRDLVGGALQAQFAKSFEKVIENLQNPNTPYKNSREIVIKLKFVQNEARDDVKCGIQVNEKLAPQTPMETSFSVGTDLKTGEVYAVEYGKQVAGQMNMQELLNDAVDPETGEVLNNHTDNVVDLRQAMNN
ncbi:MAG: hypothetical protein E7319_02300 [Clostridiales bacterium]|nr:hypothetical protein [Clostridiales bacterium]